MRVYNVTTGPPPDTTIPFGAFSTPASAGQVPVGPVTITGTATDNQALGTVYIALKRNDTNTWLRANGTYGAFGWLPVTVASPGADVQHLVVHDHAAGDGWLLHAAACRRRCRQPERHPEAEPDVLGGLRG